MNMLLKVMAVSAAIIAMATMLTGCGEGREDNIPAVKLTASALVSDISNGHGHNVEIPFIDISATPGADLFQYRSSDNTGHSHVIALSKQQMIDLNNGMRLTLSSSAPNSGTVHTHIWNIQGGNVLYDKNCYNCHTNDKRGHSPMNVSFNSSQTSAVKNPGAQALSTSAAAVPDPAFTPSTSVSLDGPTLYANNCLRCHGPLASSSKLNKSFTQIKAAITNNTGGMASLGGLTDAQIQAIATALIK
ncbi:MAG: cytochrome c [Pelobacteraceae bacterium]